MARRYFNWKLAVVLVLGVSMLGVTAFGLRKWQKGQKSDVAYRKGNKAFDEQNWDEAASNLGRYISSNREDIEMLHKYAKAQMNRRPRNVNQVVNAYRMIRQVDESDVEATRNISELYLRGAPGEAESILLKFPDIDSNPDLGTLLARAMSAQKKFEESEKLLKKIIEAHPEHIQAYGVLAQFVPYQLAGQPPEKIIEQMKFWLDKAVENNPSTVSAYLMRANYLIRVRDAKGADDDLAKALELKTVDADEKLSLAKVLYIANKLDDSEKILEEIADEDPQNIGLWTLWVDLARSRNSDEKLLEIVRNAQKALERDPWDFMPIAVEIFIQSKQIEDAKECVSKLKVKKMNPLVVARLEAMLIDQQGDPFKSIEAWREVIGLAGRSSGTSFPEKAVRMSLATAYFRANDPAAGVREITELLEKYPSYWQGHLVLARNAFNSGNLLLASEHAGKVIQLVPGHIEASSLYIQARVQMLSQSESQASLSDVEALEKQIAELAKIPSMAIQAELLRFRIAIGKADFETAENISDKLKTDYPDDIRAAMTSVDLYAVQNKTDETIVLLEQVIEQFPKADKPIRFLVSILAWKNEQEKCFSLINAAIGRNDDPAWRLSMSFILAELHLSWNQQDELFDLLTGLIEDYPQDIQVKTRFLMTQKIIGDPAKGQKVVDAIKAITGEQSWQWRYHQSRLWYLSEGFQEHYSDVVSMIKRNLLENPTDQQSRLLLANSYFKAGDVQLALSIFRQAFDRSPDDPGIIFPMVSALYQSKEFGLADEILSKVSAKTMQNSQLMRLKANSQIRQGNYAMASDLLRNSLKGKTSSDSDRFTLAILEMEQKNFSEAAEMLEELKSSVNDSRLQLSIVAAQIQLNLQQNNSLEAIKICDEQVEANSDAASLILRAQTYFSIKENEKALADFNLALEKEPENVDAWVARSRFYASSDERQKAIDDMVKALSIDGTNVQMQRRTISLMLSSGNKDAVISGRQLLNKSLAESPEDADLMMIKAQLFYSAGTVPSLNESVLILEKIIRKTPSNIDAWTILGQIAIGRQQYDKVISYAQRGLLSKPDDRRLMLLKARGESGRSPAFALSTLKALYDLEPDNVENAIFLADTYSQSGQTKKAVEFLETQLTKTEDEHDSLRCRIALAQAMYRNNQHSDAEKMFTVLIGSESISLATLATYTSLLAESGEFDKCFEHITNWVDGNPDKSLTVIGIVERLVSSNTGNSNVSTLAIKALEKVSAANPDAPDSLQSMAVMYQMTGQNDKAVSMYERVQAIRPDDVITLNNLAWAYCQKEGMYQKALEMANRGLKTAPDYIDLIDTRGFIYTKMREYEKSIADFKRCLALYPKTNPAIISTRLHLAKAYNLSGQKDLAIKELIAILALKERLNKQIREMKRAELAEALNLLNTLSK